MKIIESIEFMDLEEVAGYLKVSLSTVYRYINSKDNPLPSFKISKKNILVKKYELDVWVENYRTNVEPNEPRNANK